MIAKLFRVACCYVGAKVFGVGFSIFANVVLIILLFYMTVKVFRVVLACYCADAKVF